jgi:hypothetical protein
MFCHRRGLAFFFFFFLFFFLFPFLFFFFSSTPPLPHTWYMCVSRSDIAAAPGGSGGYLGRVVWGGWGMGGSDVVTVSMYVCTYIHSQVIRREKKELSIVFLFYFYFLFFLFSGFPYLLTQPFIAERGSVQKFLHISDPYPSYTHGPRAQAHRVYVLPSCSKLPGSRRPVGITDLGRKGSKEGRGLSRGLIMQVAAPWVATLRRRGLPHPNVGPWR